MAATGTRIQQIRTNSNDLIMSEAMITTEGNGYIISWDYHTYNLTTNTFSGNEAN